MTDTNQPNDNALFDSDLEILAEVSQLLAVVDLDRVLQRVIALGAKAVGAAKTSFFLHDGSEVDWEHLVTMRDLSPEESIEVVERVLDEGFAGWVRFHKQGDIIYDTKDDDRWVVFPDDKTIVRSALCVPFMYEGDVIATVTHVHPEPHHFTPYHLRLQTVIANQAALALRNAQLFQHIEQQRHQLTAILQSITDVLLVLDQDKTIIMINDTARRLLDVAGNTEAIGKPLAEFVMVDDVFDPLVAALDDDTGDTPRQSFDVRSERHQIDYQVTIGRWQATPQAGNRGYVVVMHNVTRLQDLARFRNEMLLVASSDLRNPLALISGYADMVTEDTQDGNSPVHGYVDIIKQSVSKMGDLVDTLLRVERIRTSPPEKRKNTDLSALVKVVLVNSRPAAEAKQLQFQSELELDDMPRVSVDPVLLRQAMEHLITNAIQFTPEGEQITVRAYYDKTRFHFSVEDTGIGIAKEHQAYIFQSFYRVDKTRDGRPNGTGLGLSLVRSVIAQHDGEVWVKSQEGAGSRFGFWLPLEQTTSDAELPQADIAGRVNDA